MSQPIQLSGLNALLGQGSKSDVNTDQLGEMLEAMELEGVGFADLLNSEFSQFLDQEQLQSIQDNPALLEDMKDNVLPLLALLGGKELPLQQAGDARLSLAELQADKALMQKAQLMLNAVGDGNTLKQGNTSLDELASMLSLENAKDGESSEEFLKQLQMFAGKDQKAMPFNQQAVHQTGVEPLTNTVGLTTMQNASQPTLQPVPTSQTIQTPPGQPGWDAQVGQRLIFMVSNEMKSAEIRLNPAELGPMEVKVKTEGEKVSVVINVQNPQVREAIEQSLPRLREIFAGQGMDLGNVDVGQHGFAQGQGREEAEHVDGHPQGYGLEADAEETDEHRVVSRGKGMVDYYI